jgi:ABC-type branched-subunit amino acid transport system ATPase component
VCLQTFTVYQNLKMGAYTRNDKKEVEDTLQMVYERFPQPGGEKKPAGGNAVRRRAADAGHGTGA